jgi:Tol biopolymer transport system component
VRRAVIGAAIVAVLAVLTVQGPGAAPAAAATAPPRLAFVDGAHVLWVVGADGTGKQPVAAAGASPSPVSFTWLQDPAWSPDGSRLAFAHTHAVTWVSARSELRVVRADGSHAKSLLSLPGAGVIQTVRWSPDGRRLAFVLWTPNPAGLLTWSSVGSRWDIYVINVDGSALRPVAPVHPSAVGDIDWSPDGKRLAFISDQGGLPGVYAVGIEGAPLPTRLSPLDVSAADPRWSPEGTRIAFTGRRAPPADQLLYGPPDLWTVRADGSQPRRLPVATWQPPSWSPDGRWLAYACPEDCGIAVIRRDGRENRVLTFARDHWPVWSRHGEIAFVRETASTLTLWVMNGDGSNQHRVTDTGSLGFDFAWSG